MYTVNGVMWEIRAILNEFVYHLRLFVIGDSTCGQRALYGIGMTGIPIFNVNNNCSTGASALLLGKQIVESGNAECVLAVGFEKMEKGSLSSKVNDINYRYENSVREIVGKSILWYFSVSRSN